jgi:hypothetical protein
LRAELLNAVEGLKGPKIDSIVEKTRGSNGLAVEFVLGKQFAYLAGNVDHIGHRVFTKTVQFVPCQDGGTAKGSIAFGKLLLPEDAAIFGS